MFKHILVPVDLAEKDTLGKAIRVAADQARHFGIGITFVSVTGGLQAKVSHSKARYTALLEEFAAGVAAREGVEIACRVYDVPDPSVDPDPHHLDLAERWAALPGNVRGGILFITAAAGQISFASDNRSTRLRVVMLVQQQHTDIPLFDTTSIHAEEAVLEAIR